MGALSKADSQDDAAQTSAQPKRTCSILFRSPLSHGYQISRVIAADDIPSFDTQDVFLLSHFTSTASINLIGNQSIWAEDVVQLALQVGKPLKMDRETR